MGIPTAIPRIPSLRRLAAANLENTAAVVISAGKVRA